MTHQITSFRAIALFAILCTTGCSTLNMSPREQLIPSDNWTWIPCDATDAEMIVNISMSGADLKRTEITIPLRKQFGDEVIAINDIWKKEWNLSLFSEIWDGEYDGGSRDITLQYIDALGLHLSARRSSGDETIDTRLVVPFKTYYHRKVGTIEYRSKWKTKEAEPPLSPTRDKGKILP